MNDLAPPYLAFWGKAQPHDDAPHSWHPAAYHLLDVAAAADEILRVRPLALSRGAQLLRLEQSEARRLLVLLAALHDVGKFARAFQAKQPELGARVYSAVELARAAKTPHTADGYALWERGLAADFAQRIWRGGRPVLDVLAPAVFGHHGRPVLATGGLLETSFGLAGVGAATACTTALLEMLLPDAITAAPPSVEQARVASWWVAGLLTLADWVGSHQEWFPYCEPGVDADALPRYWAHAQRCAERAVAVAGLRAVDPAPLRSFAELTRKAAPTPVQRRAAEMDLPPGPLLVVIEDVTGAGKTEAAQMLVHRLMASGRAAGAYWAMPTQATANAMYERQADALDALFAPDPLGRKPSLALAHGQTKLHETFQSRVLGGVDAHDLQPGARASDEELPSSAACAAFLADDRRAALLAEVGAGTVDQALLGVLPSRFNAVRLFGLADKVLVVDEAHAYDAYVSTELRELLRFQAALGGCAVVLSATLARRERQSFVDAWAEGVNGGVRAVPALPWLPAPSTPPTPVVQQDAYPLATIGAPAAGGGVQVREEPVAAADWSTREVAVRFVDDVENVVEHLADAARRGAAVVWVRNTVDSCLDGAARLEALGLTPLVFHARFAQGDRQAREREVLRRFGRSAATEDRRGAVLVATQVVEQSLDLDFDVMVSDLAPVDLLIQRAGRLWRHPERNAGRPSGVKRELVVLSPGADDEVAADWPKPLLPGTGAVYGRVGVLWRTRRALAEAGAIVTPGVAGAPGALRSLVEAAYASDEMPEALRRADDRALGDALAAASTANHSVLAVPDGYEGNARGWVNDMRVPTRLGDDQTPVRLARLTAEGDLSPWVGDVRPEWKAWALSEVRVPVRRIPRAATAVMGAACRARADAVRSTWAAFEQDLPLVPLAWDADGGVWRATLRVPEREAPIEIRYTAAAGLAYGPGAAAEVGAGRRQGP